MCVKYIHLMYPEKFVREYIEFIHDEFCASEHEFYFIHMKHYKKFPNAIPELDNVIKVNDTKAWFKLLKAIYKSKINVFHSLNKPLLTGIACLPFIASKSHWIAWGSDLHYYKTHRGGVYELHEKLRKFCIKRFSGFYSSQASDYQLIRQLYGFKGKYYCNFAYPTNTKWERFVKVLVDKPVRHLSVMVGQSGAKEIKHIQIFKQLKLLVEMDFIGKVYCPLSYGRKDYIKEVKNSGVNLLGTSFVPIEDFMPFDDYVEWLRTNCDILILSGDSSRGYGNIILATALGKTVVMDDSAAYRKGLKDIGIQVKPLSEFMKNPSENTMVVKKANLDALYKNFSRKKLVDLWHSVFD